MNIADEDWAMVEESQVGYTHNESSIRLNVWGGLGDQLAALPVGYAIREQLGSDVYVGMKFNGANVTKPNMAEVPYLELVKCEATTSDNIVDLTKAWDWNGIESLLDVNLARLGMQWGSTPRTALLHETKFPQKIDNNVKYVIVCGQGNSVSSIKRFNNSQVSAITRAANRLGYVTVAVGAEKERDISVNIDLRGETDIAELCELVCHATLVVSTDTGILHLAGAYQVPVYGIFANQLVGAQFAEYCPIYIESGNRTSEVDECHVYDITLRLLSIINSKYCVVGPDRVACGVTEYGKQIAGELGVEYKEYSEHDGSWCIAEYHDADIEQLYKYCNMPKTVISAHKYNGLNFANTAGFIFRSRQAYDKCNRYVRRGYYIPLHSYYVSSEPSVYRNDAIKFVWHGQARKHKGIDKIVDAFAEAKKTCPNIELTLIGSLPDFDDDEQFANWLQNDIDKRVKVILKKYHTQAELHEHLLAADAFVYADNVDKEQSGVVNTAMGYGKPIIVNQSSAFDDSRAWCLSTIDCNLSDAMIRIASDNREYDYFAKRSFEGSRYRDIKLVARQYRASIIQCMIDKGV